MKTPNLNPPNHDLFDAWTEASAYILGFWYTDGGLELDKKPSGNYKVVAIYNTDLESLIAVQRVTGGNIITKTPKNHKYKIFHTLRIYSDKLWDFLYNAVLTTHKSDGNSFRMDSVPTEFFSHFVRGCFDGDGSIFYKHYKNRHGKTTSELNTSFTAGNLCNQFLVDLQNRLLLFISVKIKKISGRASRKLAYNQYDSGLLCEWMYENANMFMKRKKLIWDTADKARILGSRKYFNAKSKTNRGLGQ